MTTGKGDADGVVLSAQIERQIPATNASSQVLKANNDAPNFTWTELDIGFKTTLGSDCGPVRDYPETQPPSRTT